MELGKMLAPQLPLEVTVWRGEEDEEGMTFTSSIAKLERDRFLVPIPPSFRSPLKDILEPLLIVGVFGSTFPKAILFYPNFNTFEQDDASQAWFNYSGTMPYELIERRRHRRIATRIPCHLTWRHVAEIKGTIINLSGGGLRLVTSHLCELGDSIVVQFPCQNNSQGSTRMSFKGKVVFCQPTIRDGERVFTVGVCFMDLSDSQQNALFRECNLWETGLKNIEE